MHNYPQRVRDNILPVLVLMAVCGLIPLKVAADVTNYKGVCQFWEGGLGVGGCTGMVGLMRLSRVETDQPGLLSSASQILFGTMDLPAIGSEITLKRSAHLRREYWPERDDQRVSQWKVICNRVGCRDAVTKTGFCGKTIGLGSGSSIGHGSGIRKPYSKAVTCPGPTDNTEYFAAGTVVRILGYQQMGFLFALVQIVKIESSDPENDEKKYEFDRKEVI